MYIHNICRRTAASHNKRRPHIRFVSPTLQGYYLNLPSSGEKSCTRHCVTATAGLALVGQPCGIKRYRHYVQDPKKSGKCLPGSKSPWRQKNLRRLTKSLRRPARTFETLRTSTLAVANCHEAATPRGSRES